jgi:hypothetical protein
MPKASFAYPGTINKVLLACCLVPAPHVSNIESCDIGLARMYLYRDMNARVLSVLMA